MVVISPILNKPSSMKKKILISGANGQLGKTFGILSDKYSNWEWYFLTKKVFDLESKSSVSASLNHIKPDVIINCAAYTAVDQAESEIEKAMLINNTSLGWIGEYAKKNDCKIIHFSTDYVYHNSCNRPLVETGECSPKSVYGKSKLAGEKTLLSSQPDSLIIRTSWVYSPFGKNFFLTIQKLAEEREELNVVNDQIGSPTYTFDLAKSCLQIMDDHLSNNKSFPTGIFNYSNEGACSWYDFAHAILELSDKKVRLIPVSSEEFPAKAPRPAFSLMSKKKIGSLLNQPIPHWRDALKNCIDLAYSKLIRQNKRS